MNPILLPAALVIVICVALIIDEMLQRRQHRKNKDAIDKLFDSAINRK